MVHGANAMCLINGTPPDARKNLATWMELGDTVAVAGMRLMSLQVHPLKW